MKNYQALAQFAVINLSLRLRLITANFGLDNSSYRAQPHSIIVKYSPIPAIQVNITKQKFSKWRLFVLWKFTDKEISEIKINSVSKEHKSLCKNTKTIIRLRLGDYRGIFSSTSSRRIFPDNHLAFGE
jgi:mRNA-degrading endonuclease RelE of RelBE toxin-antitoxin system